MGIKTFIKNIFKRTGDRIEDNTITRDENKATSELQKYVVEYQGLKIERDRAKINATKFRTMLEKDSGKLSRQDLIALTEEQAAIKKFEKAVTKQLWDLKHILLDLNKLIKTEFHETIVELERPLSSYNLVVTQFKESFEANNVLIIPLNPSQQKTLYKHFEDMEKRYNILLTKIIELLKLELSASAPIDKITMANNMRQRSKLRLQINRQTFAIRGKFSAIAKEFRRIKTDKNSQTFEVLNAVLQNMEQQFDAVLQIFEERRKLAITMISDAKRLRMQTWDEIAESEATLKEFYKKMQLDSRNLSPEQNKTLIQLQAWEEQNMLEIRSDKSLMAAEIEDEKKNATFTVEAIQGMQKSIQDNTKSISQTLSNTLGVSIHTPRSVIALVLAGLIVAESVAVPSGMNPVPVKETTKILSVAQFDKEFDVAKQNAFIYGSEITKQEDVKINADISINKDFQTKMTYAKDFRDTKFNDDPDSLSVKWAKQAGIDTIQIAKIISNGLNKYVKDNGQQLTGEEKDAMIISSLDSLTKIPGGIDSLITNSKLGIESHACIMGSGVNFARNIQLAFNRGDSVRIGIMQKMLEQTKDPIMKSALEKVMSQATIIPSIVINSNQVKEAIMLMNANAPNKFSDAEKGLFKKGQDQMDAFSNNLKSKSPNEIQGIIANIKLENVFSEDVIAVLKKFDKNLIWLRINNNSVWEKIKNKLDNNRDIKVNLKLQLKLPVIFKGFKVVERAPHDAVLNEQPPQFMPQEKYMYPELNQKPIKYMDRRGKSGGRGVDQRGSVSFNLPRNLGNRKT